MCSKIDHILEPGKTDKFHQDLLCDTHSKEISKLGYCSNHKKLAELENFCGECSFSKRDKIDGFCEVSMKCSCCGLSLERESYSSCIMIKPSLDILGFAENDNFVQNDDQIEFGDNLKGDLLEGSMDRFQIQDGMDKKGENQILSEENYEEEQNYSVFGGKIEAEDSNLIKDPSFGDNLAQIGDKEGVSAEILSHHLEFFISHGGFRLIPVELIDSATEENQSKDIGDENCEIFRENIDFRIKFEEGLETGDESGGDIFAVIETMEINENKKSLNFHPRKSAFSGVYYGKEEVSGEMEPNDLPAKEEELGNPLNEAEAEVSIGTEIPDLELTDEIQDEENLPADASLDEGSSTSFANFHQNEINGIRQTEEETKELNTISIDVVHNAMNFKMSNGSELSDIEEDEVPDTTISIDSLHQLHKKFLMPEKRDFGAEESLDGSAASELEGGDVLSTVDGLKSALKAERKTLQTLYAELEEERSASAIATNQTMAMITRLQEEKATMQMESLQYQRMIEEQSEYDQEALQLLSELMVKREKEKQELQRELDVYQKKVLEYEGKEKFRLLRRTSGESVTSESFSGSSGNNGDRVGLSIDLNREAKEEDGFEHENGNHDTPVDEVLDLQESLGIFEGERISILEQLKALEEKLFTMTDDEEEHFEDVKPIEHFYEKNGKHPSELENGFHGNTNGNIDPEGRIKGVKGKRLLPLFDEMSDKNMGKMENRHVNEYCSCELENSNFENGNLENKRNVIEEEVDQLYGRLRALEEDNKFLKQCMSSLNKGDKGMDLLQEILKHLHDLRNVELRVRNLGDPNLV